MWLGSAIYKAVRPLLQPENVLKADFVKPGRIGRRASIEITATAEAQPPQVLMKRARQAGAKYQLPNHPAVRGREYFHRCRSLHGVRDDYYVRHAQPVSKRYGGRNPCFDSGPR